MSETNFLVREQRKQGEATRKVIEAEAAENSDPVLDTMKAMAVKGLTGYHPDELRQAAIDKVGEGRDAVGRRIGKRVKDASDGLEERLSKVARRFRSGNDAEEGEGGSSLGDALAGAIRRTHQLNPEGQGLGSIQDTGADLAETSAEGGTGGLLRGIRDGARALGRRLGIGERDPYGSMRSGSQTNLERMTNSNTRDMLSDRSAQWDSIGRGQWDTDTMSNAATAIRNSNRGESLPQRLRTTNVDQGTMGGHPGRPDDGTHPREYGGSTTERTGEQVTPDFHNFSEPTGSRIEVTSEPAGSVTSTTQQAGGSGGQQTASPSTHGTSSSARRGMGHNEEDRAMWRANANRGNEQEVQATEHIPMTNLHPNRGSAEEGAAEAGAGEAEAAESTAARAFTSGEEGASAAELLAL